MRKTGKKPPLHKVAKRNPLVVGHEFVHGLADGSITRLFRLCVPAWHPSLKLWADQVYWTPGVQTPWLAWWDLIRPQGEQRGRNSSPCYDAFNPYPGWPGSVVPIHETFIVEDCNQDAGTITIRYFGDAHQIHTIPIPDDARAKWTGVKPGLARFQRRVAGHRMPRWMTRHAIEILDIRPVRLHHITFADACEAGFAANTDPKLAFWLNWSQRNRNPYAMLDKNPWIYSIHVRRVAPQLGLSYP